MLENFYIGMQINQVKLIRVTFLINIYFKIIKIIGNNIKKKKKQWF